MAEKKPNKRTESRRVLMFNSKNRLCAIFTSRLEAAKQLGCRTQQINNACDGDKVTLDGTYLRWWDPTIDIDAFEELGILNIVEYDKLCGVKRELIRRHKNGKKEFYIPN